jgi:hypothetical protein
MSAPLKNQRCWVRFPESIFGQDAASGLACVKPFIMPLPIARSAVICFCLGLFLMIPAAVYAQTNYYTTNGTEYAVVGSLLGDQVFPDAAVTTNGGFIVWQDNATDGSGWGVSARRVDSTLSGVNGTFRVNVIGTNDQENARVALLKGGGAVFVWQGGVEGYQSIYARFLTSTNTWTTANDVFVNTFTNNFSINPVATVLDNSNVVVVWAGFNQAATNSLLDVYGQIFSPTGQAIGTNFLVNQFISFNQRTPAIAALKGGRFVVTWVSEQQRATAPVLGTNSTYVAANSVATPSVDLYARIYNGGGVASGEEFLVNSNFNPCANPSVAAASDGSFLIAWGAFDMVNTTNAWDIYARSFSSNGVGGAVALVNTYRSGSEYAPRASAIGTDYLVIWTSLGQDGSREGVYGQFLHGVVPVGGEFRVNTTTIGQQMQPAVTSDGINQFLVVWTSYTGNPYSFDLFAQRYANVASLLQPMAAPFVWVPFVLSNNVYQPQLVVSWAPLQGISISNYEVYVDGAATPTGLTTSNIWTMTAANGLMTNSTHYFQVDYVTTAGQRPSLSPTNSGTTWTGLNWSGIPYEWMAANFGGYSISTGKYTTTYWPAAGTLSATGGPTLAQIFLSGGNPFDSGTWLKTTLAHTSQGMFLSWNTQPGATYQVQVTTDFKTWTNVGAPRFAAGASDSINVGGSAAGFYRMVLLR